MSKNILVLGGYGGVGHYLVDLLAKDGHNVFIAGRNADKGQEICDSLLEKYPGTSITFRKVDARSNKSLYRGIEGMDLVIVTATVPDRMGDIARIALQHGVDLMDILVRSDVISQLKEYEQQVIEDGRQFYTQCGFHPGMILPLMGINAERLDVVDEINVFMAMEPVFKTAESTKEIFFEALKTVPIILKNGQWIKASYTDSKSMVFSPPFGKKNCYPLHMPEINQVDLQLGVRNAGVYVGGFNWFIDYVVFTLAFILGKIDINLSQNVCSWILFQCTKGGNRLPKVEMISHAKGIHNGNEGTASVILKSDDGYLLTAQTVYALVDQYIQGGVQNPGVHLMGEVINKHKMIHCLSSLGVEISNH